MKEAVQWTQISSDQAGFEGMLVATGCMRKSVSGSRERSIVRDVVKGAIWNKESEQGCPMNESAPERVTAAGEAMKEKGTSGKHSTKGMAMLCSGEG